MCNLELGLILAQGIKERCTSFIVLTLRSIIKQHFSMEHTNVATLHKRCNNSKNRQARSTGPCDASARIGRLEKKPSSHVYFHAL